MEKRRICILQEDLLFYYADISEDTYKSKNGSVKSDCRKEKEEPVTVITTMDAFGRDHFRMKFKKTEFILQGEDTVDLTET